MCDTRDFLSDPIQSKIHANISGTNLIPILETKDYVWKIALKGEGN